MTSTFPKASVFAVLTESDACSKQCLFKCLHFKERFQMYAFSDRFSVDARPKGIRMHAFSNENPLVRTGGLITENSAAKSARFLE